MFLQPTLQFSIGAILICAVAGFRTSFGTRTLPERSRRQNDAQGIVPRQDHKHPKILNLVTQCSSGDLITITVDFDSPFSGVVYSKGHFSDRNCLFAESNADSGKTLSFAIPSGECGTVHNRILKTLTNTLIFQMDSDVQEIWDTAHKVSCNYGTEGGRKTENHQKMVVFKPLSVGMLDVQHHPIKSETLDCWMDIQVGKYPNTSPIQGEVPLGEELSLLIYLKDAMKEYDVRVKDCWAYESDEFEGTKTSKVQLTGYDGCPRKVKLIGEWDKTVDTGDSGATTIAFTNITAFKFPSSDNVHLTCNIELCRGLCEQEECSSNSGSLEPMTSAAPLRVTTSIRQPYSGQSSNGYKYPSSFQTTPSSGKRPSIVPEQNNNQPPFCYGGTNDPRCQSATSQQNKAGTDVVMAPTPEYGVDNKNEGASNKESMNLGYVPTSGYLPYNYYDRSATTTRPRFSNAPIETSSPQCYPGQQNSDPRCPRNYSTTMKYGTEEVENTYYSTTPKTVNAYSKNQAVTYQAATPTTTYRPYAPTTTRKVLCYPGQIDPRCPGSGTTAKPGTDEAETSYDTEAPYQDSSRQPVKYQPTTTPIRPYSQYTTKSKACYPGSSDPSCRKNSYTTTMKYESEKPGETYYTTNKPRSMYSYTTKETMKYKPMTTTTRPYSRTTTKKVLCYPGQIDPRCPGSYTTSKAPYQYSSKQPVKFQSTTTTDPPYSQPTSKSKSCYPGSFDPNCRKSSYTTTMKYESEKPGGTYYTTNKPKNGYGYTPKETMKYEPTTTVSPYTRTTTRKVLCYPGQIDPRCPGSYTTSKTPYKYSSKQPVKYQSTTTTVRPYSQPTSKSKSCYLGSFDPNCRNNSYTTTTRYESEKPEGTYYTTIKPKSGYGYTPKETMKYQPTTTVSPYSRTTTRKVLCYPGQIDPRCPGSYTTTERPNQYSSKQPVNYQPFTTTARPYSPNTPESSSCYPGSPDPSCRSSYTTKIGREPEKKEQQMSYTTAVRPYSPTTSTEAGCYPGQQCSENYSSAPPMTTSKPEGFPGTGTYPDDTNQKDLYYQTTTLDENPEVDYKPAYEPSTVSMKPYVPYGPQPGENLGQAGYDYSQPATNPFEYGPTTQVSGSQEPGMEYKSNSNFQYTSEPFMCYPGQLDPRCPPVCSKGSADPRCDTSAENDYEKTTKGPKEPMILDKPSYTSRKPEYGSSTKKPVGYQQGYSGNANRRNPEEQEGYFYNPPGKNPFTDGTGTGNSPSPVKAASNYKNGVAPTNRKRRPVLCYPGQIDPRCPKVCYEGSTDRRCTKKREVNQLVCFNNSSDPRCPRFQKL